MNSCHCGKLDGRDQLMGASKMRGVSEPLVDVTDYINAEGWKRGCLSRSED